MDVKAATRTGIKTGRLTSETYTEAVRVDTRGCGIQGKTIVLITNTTSGSTGTGATGPSPIFYKIDGYPYDKDGSLGGKAVAVKAATSIAYGASTVVSTDVDKGYAAVVVSVACDNSTGSGPSAADYQIEYTTY
jgi:hypothetical protein